MQRTGLLALAVALAASIAIASEARATTFQLGDLSPKNGVLVISAFAASPPVTNISDRFRFSLSQLAPALKFEVDIQDGGIFDIATLSLRLVGPSGNIGPVVTGDPHFEHVYANLGIGDYFFRATGTVDQTGGDDGLLGYRYQFQAKVVPIMGAAWLFLTALGGLGAVGYWRRQRSTTPAH